MPFRVLLIWIKSSNNLKLKSDHVDSLLILWHLDLLWVKAKIFTIAYKALCTPLSQLLACDFPLTPLCCSHIDFLLFFEPNKQAPSTTGLSNSFSFLVFFPQICVWRAPHSLQISFLKGVLPLADAFLTTLYKVSSKNVLLEFSTELSVNYVLGCWKIKRKLKHYLLLSKGLKSS